MLSVKRLRSGAFAVAMTAVTLAGYPRFTSWFDPTFHLNDVKKLKEVAEVLRDNTDPGDLAWGFCGLPISEADLTIPREMAMGNSSYMSDMSNEKAARLKLSNLEYHATFVARRRPQIVILRESDFDFDRFYFNEKEEARRTREMMLASVLKHGYRLVGEFEDYGANSEKIWIYVAGKDGGGPMNGDKR